MDYIYIGNDDPNFLSSLSLFLTLFISISVSISRTHTKTPNVETVAQKTI